MSLKSLVKKKSIPVTITRDSGTQTVSGFRVPAASTSISSTAYLQPMSLKELRNVPEGQNTMAWFNVWSINQILDRDKINDGTDTYTVQRASPRPEGGFYRGQAVKVNDAP